MTCNFFLSHCSGAMDTPDAILAVRFPCDKIKYSGRVPSFFVVVAIDSLIDAIVNSFALNLR